MTEQQSSPEQMATGEGAGEYGGTYKVRGGDRARAGSARCRRSPRSAAGAEVSPVPKRCAAGWGSKRPPNAAGWRCHCWDKRVHTLFGAALQLPAGGDASSCVCGFPAIPRSASLQEMEHCHGWWCEQQCPSPGVFFSGCNSHAHGFAEGWAGSVRSCGPASAPLPCRRLAGPGCAAEPQSSKGGLRNRWGSHPRLRGFQPWPHWGLR